MSLPRRRRRALARLIAASTLFVGLVSAAGPAAADPFETVRPYAECVKHGIIGGQMKYCIKY